MKKIILGLSLLSALNSHAFTPVQLSKWIQDARTIITSEVKSDVDCELNIGRLYYQAYQMSFENVDRSDLNLHSKEISQSAFVARLELRAMLAGLERRGVVGGECIKQIRNTLRAFRYIEESVAVIENKPAEYDEDHVAPYLRGIEPYLRVNPRKVGMRFPEDLKSGDLLISRGGASTSALIARLGDIDGQFSHLAMIYVDPKTKKVWVMEEHIEIGSAVRPFHVYAQDKNYRVEVLRQYDSNLAERSAQYMFDRLNQKNVPYDFAMDMSTNHEMFCSEVAFDAYKVASGGEFMLGRYPTTFSPKNTSLLDSLGVKADSMFAPSDLELDTRFEVLAEWKDISRVIDNQIKDAVLTEYLRWMDDYGYRLTTNFKTDFLTKYGYKLRHSDSEWLRSLMEKKFALNMTKEAMHTVIIYYQVAEAIVGELRTVVDASIARTGHPMTFQQMFKALERIREHDLKLYQSGGSSVFTKWFHP